MPYSTEMFFALLDVNTAVSEASSNVDDSVARCPPFYKLKRLVCALCLMSKFSSQELIIIYFSRCHYI